MKKRLPKITEEEVRWEWVRIQTELNALPARHLGMPRAQFSRDQKDILRRYWEVKDQRQLTDWWRRKYGWGCQTTLKREVNRMKATGEWNSSELPKG